MVILIFKDCDSIGEELKREVETPEMAAEMRAESLVLHEKTLHIQHSRCFFL